jgi:hypothetical protein
LGNGGGFTATGVVPHAARAIQATQIIRTFCIFIPHVFGDFDALLFDGVMFDLLRFAGRVDLRFEGIKLCAFVFHAFDEAETQQCHGKECQRQNPIGPRNKGGPHGQA